MGVSQKESKIVRILEVKAHNTSFELKENFQITESQSSMIYEVMEIWNKIHSAFNFYDEME
jgi:hypothetical protein